MPDSPFPLSDLARLSDHVTRSISAENPTGAKAGGARAEPDDDAHCAAAARNLGRGWKVRPCLRNLEPGSVTTLAEVEGPGIVQHIWCTVDIRFHRRLVLRILYDDQDHPSVEVPLGDFFANGINGLARINSIPIGVYPRGGMNCYWPMPFHRRVRIELRNDGPEAVPELFYQVTCALGAVADDAACFHATWRRSTTTRESPEHTILDGVVGRGHYVGTYLVWNQFSSGWWGEGEVKFFIDGDPADAPTICGTGTEDYFGGAWGFTGDEPGDIAPSTFSGPFLGYPQSVYEPSAREGQRVPAHGLYRWHVPDPIRFKKDLRVAVQALGWWPDGTYQPLTDDIASTAYWYQMLPGRPLTELPAMAERRPR